MANMADSTIALKTLERKYGDVLFRMALAHMVDVGARNLTDENVEAAIEQISAKDAADKDNGAVSIMTPEFQIQIVRCAVELAKFSIWDVLQYLKGNGALIIR